VTYFENLPRDRDRLGIIWADPRRILILSRGGIGAGLPQVRLSELKKNNIHNRLITTPSAKEICGQLTEHKTIPIWQLIQMYF